MTVIAWGHSRDLSLPVWLGGNIIMIIFIPLNLRHIKK